MLKAPTDISDEDAFTRTAQDAARRILRRAVFAEAALPPGRREWFAGFLVRSARGGLRKGDPDALDELWRDFTDRLTKEGIVATVLAIMQGADEADALAEQRGWPRHDRRLTHAFLQDRADMRELVASALLEADRAVWSRYPAWFGHIDHPGIDLFAMRRALAARWLPRFDYEDTLLSALLDDAIPAVRHMAAVGIARRLLGPADAPLLQRLHEAADDRGWVWSWRDHGDQQQRGCDMASALLRELTRPQPLPPG